MRWGLTFAVLWHGQGWRGPSGIGKVGWMHSSSFGLPSVLLHLQCKICTAQLLKRIVAKCLVTSQHPREHHIAQAPPRLLCCALLLLVVVATGKHLAIDEGIAETGAPARYALAIGKAWPGRGWKQAPCLGWRKKARIRRLIKAAGVRRMIALSVKAGRHQCCWCSCWGGGLGNHVLALSLHIGRSREWNLPTCIHVHGHVYIHHPHSMSEHGVKH